jgi:hypothetical protein
VVQKKEGETILGNAVAETVAYGRAKDYFNNVMAIFLRIL